MMCLWRALAIALDSFGLSRRAGMVTGRGGASWGGWKFRFNAREKSQETEKLRYSVYSVRTVRDD